MHQKDIRVLQQARAIHAEVISGRTDLCRIYIRMGLEVFRAYFFFILRANQEVFIILLFEFFNQGGERNEEKSK